MLMNLLKNIGMPIKVGIDIDAHRLDLSFKCDDSVNGLLQKFLKLLIR